MIEYCGYAVTFLSRKRNKIRNVAKGSHEDNFFFIIRARTCMCHIETVLIGFIKFLLKKMNPNLISVIKCK